jgi:sugar-phosphatase
MISARAARMKCVVVPAPAHQHLAFWSAANYKIESFSAFDDRVLEQLK